MLKRIKNTITSTVSNKISNQLDKSFGPKTLVMCKSCYAFYYKRVWHFEMPSYVKDEAGNEVPLRLTECPACVEMEVAITERDGDLISSPTL